MLEREHEEKARLTRLYQETYKELLAVKAKCETLARQASDVKASDGNEAPTMPQSSQMLQMVPALECRAKQAEELAAEREETIRNLERQLSDMQAQARDQKELYAEVERLRHALTRAEDRAADTELKISYATNPLIIQYNALEAQLQLERQNSDTNERRLTSRLRDMDESIETLQQQVQVLDGQNKRLTRLLQEARLVSLPTHIN